jgi:hypothetical protein
MSDLVLKNGFTRFKEMGGAFYNLFVDADGFMVWRPYEVFETRCSIDISKFPYDTQSCNITFVVWSYGSSEVRISNSSRGVDFFLYEDNSVWTVISTKYEINLVKSESEITFSLELQRKPQYYVMNMIIPIVCLGLMSLLVFIIPVDAGEKMSYSITVFLSFAVFLTTISGELPVNSESISMLSFYLILQMLAGVLVLVISAIELRLHHRKATTGIPKFYLKIVAIEQYLRCKKTCRSTMKSKVGVNVKPEEGAGRYNDDNDKTEEGHPDMDWGDVTSAIDFFSFWVFLVVNISLTGFLFAYIS